MNTLGSFEELYVCYVLCLVLLLRSLACASTFNIMTEIPRTQVIQFKSKLQNFVLQLSQVSDQRMILKARVLYKNIYSYKYQFLICAVASLFDIDAEQIMQFF